MTKLKFEELQHKFQSSGKTLKAFLKEEGMPIQPTTIGAENSMMKQSPCQLPR